MNIPIKILPILIFLVFSGCLSEGNHLRRELYNPGRDSKISVYYNSRLINRKKFKQVKKNEGNNLKSNLKFLFDLDFKIKTDKYFNIAYRSDNYRINSTEKNIDIFFHNIYSQYFIYEINRAIDIVIFRDRDEFQKKTGTEYYGFYGPRINTFFTYTGSGYGTLWHELIHAFINNNSPVRPQQWFDEGFASFYEMSFVRGNRVLEGYTNWRLPQLQKAVREKKVISLEKMITNTRFIDDNGYAQARHFFCYLWIHNKMIPFVTTYLYKLLPEYDENSIGTEAVKLLEKMFKMKIDEIDLDFKNTILGFKLNRKLRKKIRKSE